MLENIIYGALPGIAFKQYKINLGKNDEKYNYAMERQYKILLYTGHGTGGSGPSRLYDLLILHGCEVEKNTTAIFSFEALCCFDAVIFPGGSYIQQHNMLGIEGADIIRRYVEQGGTFIGICAGAYLGCNATNLIGLGLIKASPSKKIFKKDNNIGGLITLNCDDVSYDCKYRNGALFVSYLLPRDVEICGRITHASNSFHKSTANKMKGLAAIIRSRCERGSVLLCGPHPESTDGMEDYTWHMIEDTINLKDC